MKDRLHPPTLPPSALSLASLFTKRHSSAFVKDGFINRRDSKERLGLLANLRLSPATR